MSSKQKTVGLLISSFLPNLGGIEVGLHNIALRVQKLGWKPIVIAPYEHISQLKKQGWNLPYETVSLPPKLWGMTTRFPNFTFKILDMYLSFLQKKHQIDFWHVTMGYPLGCAMVHYVENCKSDIQYLIRCAGEDIQRKPDIGYGLRLNPKFDKVISSYLSRAQRLVAITPSVYEEYKGIGVDDEHIINIPNGVAVDRFVNSKTDRKAVRKQYGVQDHEQLILCVGRNHPKKNYDGLIRAVAALKALGFDDFKIMCVGSGCSQLSALVDELGMTQHVILIDGLGKNPDKKNIELPVQDLIDVYKSADIFAFPSFTETFGIAIVEAMAAGLPVIVGDSEGCRDIVEKGKFGIMCDPHKQEDLASAIKRVIDEPDLKADLIAKSQKRALDFDWDTIAGKYVAIYEAAQKT